MEGEVEESAEHSVVEEEEEGGEQDMGIYMCSVSVLGRDEGYTVKYTLSPEGVPEGEAQGYS